MEEKDRENVSLKNILVRYMRHWKLFLAVFILSFIPAVLYLQLYPRTYEFAASILLQDEKESPMSAMGLGEAAGLMKSFGIGGLGSESLNIDDEIEILASNRIFRSMILDLGINVIYKKPYSFYKMYNEAPLTLTADSATMANLQDEYRFAVSVEHGQIRVKAKTYPGKLNKTFTFTSLPATMRIDRDVFTLDFCRNGSQANPFKLNIRVLPAGWMAETLSKKIEIEDVSKSSNVLTLTHGDHVKQRGLDMLNSLIRVYNEDIESYKHIQANKTMVFVDNRISEVVTALNEVETGLQDFKKKNNMTLLEADVTLYSELFKDLITAITEEEAKAYQIDLLDEYLHDPANRNKPIPSIFSVDEGEKGVIAQYNKIVAEREKILKNSNESNFMYRSLSAQTDALRESVMAMIGNARKGIAETLSDLKSRENELQSKFRSIPEKEREYVGFMRDQEILHGIYLIMLQKREETIHSLGKQLDRARVIEPPYIRKKPLGPRKLYAGIGIIVLTLAVPVAYLFAKGLIISIIEEYKRIPNS